MVIDDEVSSSMINCVKCGSKCPSIDLDEGPSPGPVDGLPIAYPALAETADSESRLRKCFRDGADDPASGQRGEYVARPVAGDRQDEAESHVERAIRLAGRQLPFQH